MQLRPQETFPILYQISDPSDATVYYVRSVMRNTVTGAIIKNNNLNYINLVVDPANSRRFSKVIQAPNDPSGTGLFIDITTTVYTDSGYTIKSTTYQENCDAHLVQERWSIAWGGGGGWGDWSKKIKEAVDYEKIGQTFKKHLDALPPIPVPTDRWDEIIGHSKDIKDMVRNMKFPDAPKLDFEPHVARITDHITRAVGAIPQADLTPVLDKIDHIKFPEPAVPEDYKPHLEKLHEELQKIKKVMPYHRYAGLLDDISNGIKAEKVERETVGKDNVEARIKNLQS